MTTLAAASASQARDQGGRPKLVTPAQHHKIRLRLQEHHTQAVRAGVDHQRIDVPFPFQGAEFQLYQRALGDTQALGRKVHAFRR